MKKLSEIAVGHKARIKHIDTKKNIKLRLIALGLYEGALIHVISKTYGITIVESLGIRIALADYLLNDIYVEDA